MKKIPFFISAALFASAAAFAGDNLVANGGFETNNGWGSDSSKDYEIVDQDARGGQYCMKLNRHAWHLIRLDKTKAHKITISVKCQDCPPDTFSVRILKKPGQGWVVRDWKFDLVKTGGTHDWREFSTVITPEIFGEGEPDYVIVTRADKQGGTVWIDDLILEMLPEEE